MDHDRLHSEINFSGFLVNYTKLQRVTSHCTLIFIKAGVKADADVIDHL